jgi:hypothetical protein
VTRKAKRRFLYAIFVMMFLGGIYKTYDHFHAWGWTREECGIIDEFETDDLTITITRLPNPDYFDIEHFCTSMDGSRYAFVNYEFGPLKNVLFPNVKFRIVVDGKILREHSLHYRTPLMVGGVVDVYPSFSPDNAFFTYAFDGQAYLNDEEASLEGYDQVLEVFFLPDGSLVHIAKLDDETFIVSSENRLGVKGDYIEDIGASLDGRILFCVSREPRDNSYRTLCVFSDDGCEYEEYQYQTFPSSESDLPGFQDDRYLLFKDRTSTGYLKWRDGDQPVLMLGQHPAYIMASIQNQVEPAPAFATDSLSAIEEQWNDDRVRLLLNDEVLFEFYNADLGQARYEEAELFPHGTESHDGKLHRSFLGWRGRRLYKIDVNRSGRIRRMNYRKNEETTQGASR